MPTSSGQQRPAVTWAAVGASKKSSRIIDRQRRLSHYCKHPQPRPPLGQPEALDFGNTITKARKSQRKCKNPRGGSRTGPTTTVFQRCIPVRAVREPPVLAREH